VFDADVSYTMFCFGRAFQRYAVRVRHLRRIREARPGETAHDPGVGGIVTLSGGERVADLEGDSVPVQVGSGTRITCHDGASIHPIPPFLAATARRRGWSGLVQDDDGHFTILLRPSLG